MFLTPEEVYRITRRRQRAAQKRVLREKGYAFDEDAAGWPLVLRATVERHPAHRPAEGLQKPSSGPDSAALAALMGSR
jgi:hypothetical protein